MLKHLSILLLTTFLSVAHAANRALVIGNSNYAGADKLINPVNDAQDMGDALESIGFQVIPYFDLDKSAMKQAINRFAASLDEGDTAVVYYSGHGTEFDGKNYLIPLEAQWETLAQLQDEAVPLTYLMAALEAAGGMVNIVILDACRDSPKTRAIRSRSRTSSASSGGLTNEQGASGSLIAYAADAGKTASDGEPGERNSPYVKYLKREIVKPQTVFDVFTNVRKAVKQETLYAKEGPQEPAFYSKLDDAVRLAGLDENNGYVPLPPREPIMPAHPSGEEITVSGRTYIAYDNGTALDTATGLLWMRCSVGQVWNGSTCTGEAEKFTWNDAIKQTARFAGYSDWRIPTIEELRTLVYCSNGKPAYFSLGKDVYDADAGCQGIMPQDHEQPTIVKSVFPGMAIAFQWYWWYWSGSPNTKYSGYAWVVGFDHGSTYSGTYLGGVRSTSTRDARNYVLLVRGGQ